MSSYQTMKTPGDLSWFTHDRFGMFIHWGLYALPARHEWIKNKERISEEKYQKYFGGFEGAKNVLLPPLQDGALLDFWGVLCYDIYI